MEGIIFMATRRHTTLGVVHATATPPGWGNGAGRIRAIHKAECQSDIGYNEIIKPDGQGEMERGRMAVGARFKSISYGNIDGRRRQGQRMKMLHVGISRLIALAGLRIGEIVAYMSGTAVSAVRHWLKIP